MSLATAWFVLVGILWSGYFLLEGFDFGVGMLLPFLPRDEAEREAMIESIGPVWDGNEVWLVTAGGATFAAFPAWYATMFSGMYLALLLVLVCLILRVVSFEWRSRTTSPAWRTAWLWANALGSLGASFVWGVGLANLLHGMPVDASNVFTGDLWSLFDGYTVLAGIAVVLVFAFHGATYLTLKTVGGLCDRAAVAAGRLAVAAALAGAGFLAWTVEVAVDGNDRPVFPPVLPAALGIAALVLALVLGRLGRRGWSFAATAGAAVMLVATLFTGLYPRVLVSSTAFANSLTVEGAASQHETLKVMTVVALVLVPVVLAYQGWTYHVFRRRVGSRPAQGPSLAD